MNKEDVEKIISTKLGAIEKVLDEFRKGIMEDIETLIDSKLKDVPQYKNCRYYKDCMSFPCTGLVVDGEVISILNNYIDASVTD